MPYLDWIVGLIGLLGRFLVGNKNRWGWLLNALSGVIFLYLAVKTGMLGLVIPTLLYTAIDIRNFKKWSESDL